MPRAAMTAFSHEMSRRDHALARTRPSPKKGARHSAPLIRLASAIDDEIDRDIKPSKLPADLGIGSSSEAASSLFDQSLTGHRHSFRSLLPAATVDI